ncbi:hypothetical protein RQP46_010072 [Phenoliferia psychrophenolica]
MDFPVIEVDKVVVKAFCAESKKSVLSVKRQMHIEIALLKQTGIEKAETMERFQAAMDTLGGKILALDESLGKTYLEALNVAFPDATELEKLGAIEETSESQSLEIHLADRFFLELLKGFRMEHRIKSWIYRLEFEETCISIEQASLLCSELSKCKD